MLSEERNRILTSTGRGTPAGELLRRYWHPVAPALELREKRVKPVRLLGEDLVLFARGDGQHGLVSRHCAHRGVDLSSGWVDGNDIRCPYHGWSFDSRGRCTAQPFEEVNDGGRFRDQVRLESYPTATLGGLVWAYLGPDPQPLLPDFEPYSWNRGFTEICVTELPCNWFHCHENGMDPVHFEWLHTNWTSVQDTPSGPPYGAPHLRIDFEEFEYGWIVSRALGQGGAGLRPASRSNTVAEGGVLCLWPYTLATGATTEWRVPIDDTHTLNITRQYFPLPEDLPPVTQDPASIPYWYGPLTDNSGKILCENTLNQDFAAWVAQGAINDRTRENLGRTDVGITRLRHRYLKEIERVAAGEDPPGIVRDPAVNRCIQLPIYHKSRFAAGLPRAGFENLMAWHQDSKFAADGYPSVQAGRPQHVQDAFRRLASPVECLPPGRH
jgi:5,5'-dehydrodivanillate O-demethylase oxygenase subunit